MNPGKYSHRCAGRCPLFRLGCVASKGAAARRGSSLASDGRAQSKQPNKEERNEQAEPGKAGAGAGRAFASRFLERRRLGGSGGRGVSCGMRAPGGQGRERSRGRPRNVGLRMRRGRGGLGHGAHGCRQGSRGRRQGHHHRGGQPGGRHHGHVERPDVDAAQLHGHGRQSGRPRRCARLHHGDGGRQVDARDTGRVSDLRPGGHRLFGRDG